MDPINWDAWHENFDAGLVYLCASLEAMRQSGQALVRVVAEADMTLDDYIAEGKAENPARWAELNAEWERGA